ncbi:MAG: molybdopterin cofactor-binding domain-containing protein [Stellaceae bacterium]
MNLAPIGERLRRREDRLLLLGLGRYLDDLPVPGCLHAVFVRSPHGRTRIRAIDTAAARALADGRLLGLGLCTVIESTTYGSGFYKAAGIPGSGHEAAMVRVEPSGAVIDSCGLMGPGQGYETTLAQALAAGLGARVEDVAIRLGPIPRSPLMAWAAAAAGARRQALRRAGAA